jgi:hypothetical protein
LSVVSHSVPVPGDRGGFILSSCVPRRYITRLDFNSMTKPFLLLCLALLLAGCGRSPGGLYQSVGSEDKFRMTLDLGRNGEAKFTTRSNLGNPELDRSVEAAMSLSNAKWSQHGDHVVVTGLGKDGKSSNYRFIAQQNGDLIWEKTGARLVKAK